MNDGIILEIDLIKITWEETIMKKQYEQPMAEKIEFNYRETVIASGGGTVIVKLKNNGTYGGNGCYSGDKNATTGCHPYG